MNPIYDTLTDVRDLLAASVERGTAPHIVRAYVLVENLLEQLFHDPDDTAALAEEAVFLAPTPAGTVCGQPLPPVA